MTPQQIAARRGWQTLADGALVVAIIAGLIPAAAAISSADGWSTWLGSWRTWSWQIFQGAAVAVGTALVSWLRRRYVQTPDHDDRPDLPEQPS